MFRFIVVSGNNVVLSKAYNSKVDRDEDVKQTYARMAISAPELQNPGECVILLDNVWGGDLAVGLATLPKPKSDTEPEPAAPVPARSWNDDDIPF